MNCKTAEFKKEMLGKYTLLAPNVAPIQFELVQAAVGSEGYNVEMLDQATADTAKVGLKYVHNDTCYPALLIIGQYIEALQSGRYDLDHTALVITQTGGGCRASNYIKLLRKALVKAGFENIPVASLNMTGLEKESSLPVSFRVLTKSLAALEYGDEIASLRNQVKPYEIHAGDTEKMCRKWIDQVSSWVSSGKYCTKGGMKKKFQEIAQDFATVEVNRENRIKVGIVGEIYVKFSPLGNNHLQDFLEAQGCEVNIPGIIGFLQYSIANFSLDVSLYGGKKLIRTGANLILAFLDSLSRSMAKAMRDAGFYAPGPFKQLMKKPDGIIHLGAKMGEGWLLTAEMVELIEDGYTNIVCAQPFGCLPNHIAGKGVISRIRACHPDANITPVDYDPSAAQVNQENRIKLMLAVARDQLRQETA